MTTQEETCEEAFTPLLPLRALQRYQGPGSQAHLDALEVALRLQF